MIPQNLPEPLLQKIVRRIHGETELDGCMIGYSHMGHERVLHKGVIPTRNIDLASIPRTPTYAALRPCSLPTGV